MNNTVRMNGSLAFGPPRTSVGNAQTHPRRGPCEVAPSRQKSASPLIELSRSSWHSLPLPESDLSRARPHTEEKPRPADRASSRTIHWRLPLTVAKRVQLLSSACKCQSSARNCQPAGIEPAETLLPKGLEPPRVKTPPAGVEPPARSAGARCGRANLDTLRLMRASEIASPKSIPAGGLVEVVPFWCCAALSPWCNRGHRPATLCAAGASGP
jgi:hypothetical protein